MYEELISKKDLLKLMDISYGQLYRWKRKNLIPEEWFIKKSVSTGQETFFPKEKILDRIDTILKLKDDVSLDELANKLSNNTVTVSLLRSFIVERNIVSKPIVDRFEEFMGYKENYNPIDLFSLIIFKELSLCGSLNIEEVRYVTIKMKDVYENVDVNIYKLIIKRKMGVLFCSVNKDVEEIFYR